MKTKAITGNKVFKAIPIILIISIILGYYHFSNLELYNIANLNLSLFIIYTVGHLEQSQNIINVLFWMFPLLLLIYLLGDSVYDSLKKQTAYIFTRTNKRSIWYIKQSIRLLFNVTFFYLIYFAGILFVGSINHISISNKTDILIIGIVLSCHIIGSYLILLLINLFSFYFKVTFAYLTVLICFFFFIMASGMIFEISPDYSYLIQWFPSSHFFISWHDNQILHDFQEIIFINAIEGFHLSITYGYYLIAFLIIMVISIRKIREIDIV
jgi:hypothetical protein